MRCHYDCIGLAFALMLVASQAAISEFMEAMNVAHFGINTGSKTMRLLVVYMGAQGSQNVIPVK